MNGFIGNRFCLFKESLIRMIKIKCDDVKFGRFRECHVPIWRGHGWSPVSVKVKLGHHGAENSSVYFETTRELPLFSQHYI